MGTYYYMLVEARHGDSWRTEACFRLGKAYELAACFPHHGWPARGSSRAPFVLDEGQLPAGGTHWASLDEVTEAFAPSDDDPTATTCVLALETAGHYVVCGADEVRLLIWGS